MKSSTIIFRIVVFLIVLCMIGFSVLSVSDIFPDILIEPKWHFSLIFALSIVSIFAIKRLTSNYCINVEVLLYFFIGSATLISLVELVIVVLQKIGYFMAYSDFSIGTFDNNAGLVSFNALVMSLIAVFLKNKTNIGIMMSIISVIGLLSCSFSIVLSMSRLGIVCCAICILYLVGIKKHKALFLFAVISISCLLLFVSSIKQKSTNGRLFILERTIEMIGEKPISGWGKGGFVANYMTCQANYFSKHDDMENAMLAGNVHHPLCEYLFFAVNHGIPLTVLMCALFFLFISYIKRTSHYDGILLPFVVVGVLSLFSYPFLYPFTWYCTMFISFLSIPIVRFKVVHIVCIAVMPFVVCMYICEMNNARSLKSMQIDAEHCKFGSVLPKYKKMYILKENDYRFLYNYATVLCDAGNYELADKIAKKCGGLLADYNLCLLKGHIMNKCRNHFGAIREFQQAHLMCPSKLVPLYEIFLVYKDYGFEEKADSIKNVIVHMPSNEKNKYAIDIINQLNNY